MLRKGVPYQFRMMVWQRYVYNIIYTRTTPTNRVAPPPVSLVFRQVGRLKEVRDAAAEGGSYYWSLVRAKGKVCVCVVM